MQQIGELIGNIIPLAIFIYIGLILHGILKYPNKEVQEKIDEYRLKKISFFIIWAGIISFSILVLKGFVSTTENSESFITGVKEGWTQEKRQAGIDDCIKNAEELNRKNPDLALKYCECSADKMMSMMTYQESLDLLEKSQEEIFKTLYPIIESCQAEIQYDDMASKLTNSNSLLKDTLIIFENKLKVKIPSGFNWNEYNRNGTNNLMLTKKSDKGNIGLSISVIYNTTFDDIHSELLGFYSNNVEPQYTLSNISNSGCPTSDCANYDMEVLIQGNQGYGKMYFFGKNETYFNAFFISPGNNSEEELKLLKRIIEDSEVIY